MKTGNRFWVIGFLVIVAGAMLLLLRPSTSVVSYTGYALTQTGDVALDVVINPPVGKPGDTLTLTARVANRSFQARTPTINLVLPAGLGIDIYDLPSGATFNVQENRIDWLPLVPAGSETIAQVDLLVQAADVLNPEHPVIINLQHHGFGSSAEAPIWIGIPPMIRDLNSVHQVAVGQPVELQAGVVGPGPLKVTWDLGDGRRLDVTRPVVVFPTIGERKIKVEVSNPAGQVSGLLNLTVLPQPVAGLHADDDTPAIGQPVLFTSTSAGQPPLTLYWDFGDGNTVTNDQQPVHIYRDSGTYLVRLVITNEFGRSEAVTRINVGVPPAADMDIPDRVYAGEPLLGQALGDPGVVGFYWDMGDGRTHTGASIRHVYRTAGDYYVTMIADNGHGETRTGRWLRVEPGINFSYLPLMVNLGGLDELNRINSGQEPILLDPAIEALTEPIDVAPIEFPVGTAPEVQVFTYLNAVRAAYDLPPLSYNYDLSVAAQAHARDKATFPENFHIGSDGTTASERILRAGYRGGYAGEATAWGFNDPRLAVEFWINSDTHRPLLLNRLATDVGIGFFEDFSSQNVWHWTVEFAISYGAPIRATIRQQLPVPSQFVVDTDITNYSWVWPLPLSAGEKFTVYLVVGERLIPIGTTASPVYGSRYIVSADAPIVAGTTGPGTAGANGFQWLVRLENNQGAVIAESERWPIALAVQSVQPTPEPTIAIITATPPGPTSTPTATPVPADTSPQPPTEVQPPPVITATPPGQP